MSWVTRDIAHCDECGFEWLPKSGLVPERCASQKCRKRTWDKSGSVQTVMATDSKPVGLGSTPSTPAMRFERPPDAGKVEVRPETQERVVEAEDVIADEDIPDPEPELEMCTYREYDDQEGEWYGCRLREHGPKVKHQRGDKL